MSDVVLRVAVPTGYTAMPLTDVRDGLTAVRQYFRILEDSPARELGLAMLPDLAALFLALVERDARYCGIGRHLSPNGDLVTSCLVTSVLETGSPARNPRLVLKGLVEERIAARDAMGSTATVEVDGRAVLFTERTVELDTSAVPGVAHAGCPTPVYQLEAVVPADDGSALVAIELSTPAVAAGPLFRKMIADMTRSVRIGATVQRRLDLP